MKKRVFSLSFAFLAAFSFSAVAVTVEEIKVDPNIVVPISVTNFYTGGVYAGIVKLKVDGQAMDGFCIDPFHFSVSSAEYNYVALSQAPKDFNGTVEATGVKAAIIANLWSLYYTPGINALQAATLQIAIWEVVGGSSFSMPSDLTDYNAAAALVTAATNLPTSDPRYGAAHLRALTATGIGQDYVVLDTTPGTTEVPPVPDRGSTLALLGMVLIGLVAVGRKGLGVLRAEERAI